MMYSLGKSSTYVYQSNSSVLLLSWPLPTNIIYVYLRAVNEHLMVQDACSILVGTSFYFSIHCHAFHKPPFARWPLLWSQAVDTRIRQLSWRNSSASFVLHRCLLSVTDTVAICVRIDLGSL